MKRNLAGILFVAFFVGCVGVSAIASGQTNCTSNALFGNRPSGVFDPPRIWANDELIDYYVGLGTLEQKDYPVAYDDFEVEEPVGMVQWWGTELDAVTQAPATRQADLFSITLYENDLSGGDPMPGAVICQYNDLEVTKTDTGVRHLNPNDYTFSVVMYRYSVALPTPCVVDDGWICIKGAAAGSANGVAFVWISSTQGNQSMREYTGLPEHDPYRVRTGERRDTAFCLLPIPIATPDLVGMTLANAENALLAAELSLGTVAYDYSGLAPSGEVLEQNPLPGALLFSGDPVNLVVADDPVPVPDVIGQTQTGATAQLVAAGLTVIVSSAYSDIIPSGTVITQNPIQGTLLEPGAAVTITVSRGPEPQLPVSSLVGLGGLILALGALGVRARRRTI